MDQLRRNLHHLGWNKGSTLGDVNASNTVSNIAPGITAILNGTLTATGAKHGLFRLGRQ